MAQPNAPTTFRSPETHRQIFSRFDARVVTAAITDFSRVNSSVSRFCEISPRTAAEAADIARLASFERVRLRVRGAGHALNGSSLPGSGELLLNTRNLVSVRHERPATVTCGGGLPLWVLRDLLNQDGWTVPVVNDGYSGPTVGGYIAAGGFGPGSRTYGGFWENVAEVLLLTPRGLERVTRSDKLFPWIFGAMGQLGVVLEARLDIIPLAGKVPLALREHSVSSARIEKAMRAVSGAPPDEAGRRLYWFTLFVPEANLQLALDDLAALQLRHESVFEYRERYAYLVHHRQRVIAPLVYPVGEDFHAVGMWGFQNDHSETGLRRVQAFEDDFMRVVLDRGFRRYVQSELTAGPDTYRRYFHPEILASFYALKRDIDPWSMFNAGSVFPTMIAATSETQNLQSGPA